jgi:hypothetical protein
MKRQYYKKHRESFFTRIIALFNRSNLMTKGPYVVKEGKQPAELFALK